MEVLQCDGCDFRAESNDELKAHIQDVHTAFLQPTEVGEGDETPRRSRSNSLHSLSQTEDEEDLSNHNYDSLKKGAGIKSFNKDIGHFSGSKQAKRNQSVKPSNKTSTPFFQCKFCVRYFRSSSLLSEHTRKVHGEASDERSLKTSKKASCSATTYDGVGMVFSCQYCTYKSPQRAQILKHQKMHHKEGLSSHSAHAVEAEVPDLDSDASSVEEHCESPGEVERNVLESMIKPQSRGSFNCEWCGFQTSQRQQLTDHMMKKHRNMVKIMVSLQQPKTQDGSAGSSKSDSASSRRSTPTSNLNLNDLASNEGSSANPSSIKGSSCNASLKATSGISSFQYSQLTAKIPNSTGSSILSERSTFTMADMSRSGMDLDASMLNDSKSSSDDELCDLDDPNYTESAEDSTKLLLSEEDNDLLETKGVPFKRHMNRFQCPFCSFLTMHRRSISRHIENIHLSGKATVYKCDECPFLCTNPIKLDAHKQCHSGSSEWDTMDLTSESVDGPSDHSVPVNGGNGSSKINGKKSSAVDEQQGPHRCSLCNFSTITLKGLRVHQQHKHSYCDGTQVTGQEGSSNEQQDSESESYSSLSFVQKTQTSILGFSTKKHLIGKTARKSINDLPLDLSPVKKRTRIDEIANNLQSKISQSQQHEDVINLEEMDDDVEENGNHIDLETSKERESSDARSQHYTFNTQHLPVRNSIQTERGVGKRKRNLQSKLGSRNIPVQVTISDDEDNYSASLESKDVPDQSSQDSRETYQDNTEFNTEEPGNLFYCKHCEYQNKSARSVSTHYQRMHPYIKFSFRYILDPEDQSAVFRCLECFIEYNNFNDLHQHYMTHHPEASNVLNFNQPDLVYMCRFCSYTSPNVRSLMPHYQRMHPSVKINNAMIFSSYMVDQPHKGAAESQTLREILNSGPKSFSPTSSGSRSSSSPALKSICKTPEANAETEGLRESLGGNVVVYDCDVCSFSSPNMHSVLVHYQKKHPEQKASYFRIQKTMRVISVDRAQLSNNSTYSLTSTPKSSNVISPAALDEDVYYCKHCVYNNRSVVGVLVHYQKRHPEIKVTAKYIKQAPPTPGLLKLMDELQIALPKQFLKQFNNNGIEGSSNSNTKGASDKGEPEMLFFCQHCDYGNRTVKGVLIHYQKKHRDVKANADLVRRHTAVVRSQRERAQMIQAGSSTSTATVVTEAEKSRSLRSLKCRHCVYTSPYVYALKKHLKKDHPTVKATAMTILHWAYQDGVLEAGYHCEWCIYSHVEPSGLLMHYQRRHPEHNVDYTYMASKLWAGPDTSTSRQAGNSETKHYQCRDCAFEACSIWDITNHYQAVHPWAVKGDESVLLDIIKGNQTPDKLLPQPPKVHVSMYSPFNSNQQEEAAVEVSHPTHERQANLSLSATTSISNSPYQCTVCLSEYNSLHGLLTHYGKKHPGMKVKAADFAQEADINPSSVYKCRQCPYVNSRIHGVLTHYQKRHPSIKVTAEDFADDVEHVNELVNEGDERSKTQRQGYGAYRCKMCTYTHGTLEKLKIHYEKYHNQSATDMFRTTATHSPTRREDSVAECSSSSVTEVSEACDFDLTLPEVAKSDKNAVFKCQLCKYFCSTRKGIARHYRIKHNNVRAQPEGKNNVFKCALCSYTNPIRKGLAAHYQKRHDIDAYYTHCLAASKTVAEKPNKVTLPLASEAESPAMSEELRLAVDRRKCSLCSFQAFSRKSIVSHYIKRHPGVFPKKQPSSKLGRYFTVIYSKEAEKPPSTEEVEVVEVKDEVEPEGEVDWLPFKCLKCFKLSFSAAELLVMHYNDCHDKELKRDFVNIPSPAEDGTELYQCTHCEIKFLTFPELSVHLINHNEDFQKRAMRLERRKQLQNKQRTTEPPEAKPENKVDGTSDKTPIGYRCNFCVEVHSTLRAICNHLRKHVQYGEAREGHVKQEAAEMPVAVPIDGITDGDEEDVVAMDTDPLETTGASPPDVTMETEEPVAVETEMMVGPLEQEQERVVPGHPCSMCSRMFMSMQGLRSHERSHSAGALVNRNHRYSCQYCQFSSPFRHNLDRHVQSHHGHQKPFRCKLCPFKSSYLSRLKSHLHKAHAGEHAYKCTSCAFSTMTIIQLKEHSLKEHGETLTLPKLKAGAALRSTRPSAEHDQQNTALDPQCTESVGYLEPADVQQQLSHFQLASRVQADVSSSPPPLESPVPPARPDSILTCEFCEFSSGYMQSLRRHYRDRHGGKKLFKCKDCSFFTCYKSTFTLHVEAGHTSGSEETPKDLRCPFCLYHTKHKSSMIDHIVLHREERVVPLEVSRSKLSRHLEGLVFRCHKCTFTCASEQNLEQHIQKHQELKPYQCQLCYYDSRLLNELEMHLQQEHKVIRNFELVGRVNLDQLELMKDKMTDTSSSEEEEERGEDQTVEEEEVEEELMEEEDEEEKLLEYRQEETSDQTEVTGVVESPSGSGVKRFPCEFCGRTFTLRSEWERHVLRHGMTVNGNKKDSSPVPSSALPLIGPAAVIDRGLDLSSNTVDQSDQSKCPIQTEEDEKTLETKNDP
ncbi:zinc finger protein 462 isoform X1 [Carassius gibelio]|uniref:zinc finger protein 462 isoform X1 n=1 Tax=Carassius gibelio TaxID=101364 RepID=UPI002279DAB9|nr:zinc finger protein 462 isoform X1 [Carassius gibelio]XP_052392533.1 zinc finger protein 462 isoform X1 [Carassius gibelio]XP_052392535.1 zinc finger protein 462 isoform X1 [Carassius gibelio]XP_052392536.1 zinc finger protein 462 isoform X1 [Carassius gibelio]XP_052392537.1 zinc finger protein 462 isoform X1 [Carassius gibelio]